MKLFIKKTLLFCLAFLIVSIIGIFLPTTPKVSKSLLFAKIDKDSMLVNTPASRLILIGGSNLSLGINSQIIKDSIKLNPVNTAIHAAIGLEFMLDHTSRFIKKGDIIIVSPEYQQYYGDTFYGDNELIRTIFDVSRKDIQEVSLKQWGHLSPLLVSYACSKYNPKDYFTIVKSIYVRNAFNKFGDANMHWGLPRKSFKPSPEIKEQFNKNAIDALIHFQTNAIKKGATVYLTYPCLQASSFNNNIKEINKVEEALKENHFKILGNPSRYKMADSLCFDTPYHLLKQGVDIRTKLLVDDLKLALAK